MEKERFEKEYDANLINILYLFNLNIKKSLEEDNSIKTMQYVTSFDIYTQINGGLMHPKNPKKEGEK